MADTDKAIIVFLLTAIAVTQFIFCLGIIGTKKGKLAECGDVLKVHGFGEYCGCLGGRLAEANDGEWCLFDDHFVKESDIIADEKEGK